MPDILSFAIHPQYRIKNKTIRLSFTTIHPDKYAVHPDFRMTTERA